MGSQSAARAIVDDAMEAHYQELCRAMKRRGHAAATSQEIVHEVYLRLAARPTLVENRPFLKAFLIRVCANLGIDRLRRERLERRLFSGMTEEALSVPQPSRDADGLADRQYRLKRLRGAIMTMSYQRRQVFLASCIGNLTADEIAARCGISRNMVDRHIRKAYLHCLECLEDTL
ncbi:RNA polymerase sigma factor [Rhizobium sp. CSW-27]|nr:RNA polymerase sigma factor [Rhizobium sp. CSW-27]